MNPASNDLPPAPRPRVSREHRRYKFRPDPAAKPVPALLARLRHDPRFARRAVQVAFVLLSVWIGVEFWLFMRWGQSGGAAAFQPRPPGAEAFLPIRGLLGLLHWARTGSLNVVHPAATVVLLAVLVVSVLVRKSFCSWICPIGTLGDALAAVGRRLFKRNFAVWRVLDYPLRAIKYALLFYFVAMLAGMSAVALEMFVYGSYNRMADVAMYRFFAHVSPRALGVLLVLAVASTLYHRFWCRYLCPYGALLGLAGLISPLRVTRVKATCIDCELCSRACPSRIAVHRIGARRTAAPLGRVWSDECTTCMRCVGECPVRDTLVVRPSLWPRSLAAPVVAAVVVGVFALIAFVAMASGHWESAVAPAEYLQHLGRPAAHGMSR